jgi:hypothetical protein
MSSNIQRKPKYLLNNVSAAGASGDITGTDNNPVVTDDILITDHRNKEVNERGYIGTLTSGDSLAIQVKLSAEDSAWHTVSTITDTTFSGILRGPWPYVRVNKTGTAGVATFYIQG